MTELRAATGAEALHFLGDLARAVESTEVTLQASGRSVSLADGLHSALELITATHRKGGKLLFAGNGGSAAISSHLAVDFWKCGNVDAMAFNDASLLTCVGNDFGYENLFVEPLRRFARAGDLFVAISSSGRSPNILNGVRTARELGCRVITASGFEADNPLRLLGDVNFWVPSHYYGHTEVAHLALLHSLLDAHMGYDGTRCEVSAR